MAINRRFFFRQVRSSLFGALRQSQVEGLTSILDAWESDHAAWDDRWLAYALGTAHLETAMTMLPIRERGGSAYFNRRYGIEGDNPARARRMGNTASGDGARYAGRGYVQLTWKSNYRRAGDKLGVDLVGNPDLALDAAVAAQIMFDGMNEGWFTGKTFSDYFDGETENWVQARRIINGLDKADNIAGYATAYYAAISHTV